LERWGSRPARTCGGVAAKRRRFPHMDPLHQAHADGHRDAAPFVPTNPVEIPMVRRDGGIAGEMRGSGRWG
jgi:hypothetical protein